MAIAELEFEEAICRRYPVLLADLAREGYLPLSRQAVLFGRRLDLVLRRPPADYAIVELKVGHIDATAVVAQILDYAHCLRTDRSCASLRLRAISTRLSDAARAELARHNIEGQAIAEREVLEALLLDVADTLVPARIKLTGDSTEDIRRLLSDPSIVEVPPDLVLAAPWDHQKVFLALVRRGEKHKDLWKKHPYVQLYPQSKNAAVLYHHAVEPAKRGPLHLNPRRQSWRPELFAAVTPFVRYVHSDNKGPGKESSNFDWYYVADWNGFAQAIGL